MESEPGIRLNKFLASCGIVSRRGGDALIAEGRVEINGQPCHTPGVRVQPGDTVKVDGKRVQPKHQSTIILHKPRGLVCTRSDNLHRDTIYAALPHSLAHLHHVGRLDRESEGLLILTTDGHLSQAMLHPAQKIEKEYIVTANQPIQEEHLRLFLSGVYIEEGKTRLRAATVERLSPRRLALVLTTGHKRQIREMLKALGYRVQRLIRIRIGSLHLGALKPGEWAFLTPAECAALLRNPPARVSPEPAAKTPRPRTRQKREKR